MKLSKAELTELLETKTAIEFDKVMDKILHRRNGKYPFDWVDKILNNKSFDEHWKMK